MNQSSGPFGIHFFAFPFRPLCCYYSDKLLPASMHRWTRAFRRLEAAESLSHYQPDSNLGSFQDPGRISRSIQANTESLWYKWSQVKISAPPCLSPAIKNCRLAAVSTIPVLCLTSTQRSVTLTVGYSLYCYEHFHALRWEVYTVCHHPWSLGALSLPPLLTEPDV